MIYFYFSVENIEYFSFLVLFSFYLPSTSPSLPILFLLILSHGLFCLYFRVENTEHEIVVTACECLSVPIYFVIQLSLIIFLFKCTSIYLAEPFFIPFNCTSRSTQLFCSLICFFYPFSFICWLFLGWTCLLIKLPFYSQFS